MFIENNLYSRNKSHLILCHYSDVTMSTMTSQITSLTIVYSTVYLGADKKNQSSASLAFVRGIHRLPVNSPHKWPVTRKMFLFDDVIMIYAVYKKVMRNISHKRDTWFWGFIWLHFYYFFPCDLFTRILQVCFIGSFPGVSEVLMKNVVWVDCYPNTKTP